MRRMRKRIRSCVARSDFVTIHGLTVMRRIRRAFTGSIIAAGYSVNQSLAFCARIRSLEAYGSGNGAFIFVGSTTLDELCSEYTAEHSATAISYDLKTSDVVSFLSREITISDGSRPLNTSPRTSRLRHSLLSQTTYEVF